MNSAYQGLIKSDFCVNVMYLAIASAGCEISIGQTLPTSELCALIYNTYMRWITPATSNDTISMLEATYPEIFSQEYVDSKVPGVKLTLNDLMRTDGATIWRKFKETSSYILYNINVLFHYPHSGM